LKCNNNNNTLRMSPNIALQEEKSVSNPDIIASLPVIDYWFDYDEYEEYDGDWTLHTEHWDIDINVHAKRTERGNQILHLEVAQVRDDNDVVLLTADQVIQLQEKLKKVL